MNEKSNEIEKINETSANAFKAVKRIYDLAIAVAKKLTDEITERLELKSDTKGTRHDPSFFNGLGIKLSLGEAEFYRYKYYFFSNKKGSSRLIEGIEPFIIASIVNKEFENPEIIYGILRWQQEKDLKKTDKDLARDYIISLISEKRKAHDIIKEGYCQNWMEKKKVGIEIKIGKKNLFEFNNETFEDLSVEIINWFSKELGL